MKSEKTLRSLIFILGMLLSLAAPAQKKAVFIIVDGIPADVIEKVATPNLDDIAKSGGYSRAHVGGTKGSYSESPTVSAVGYNHVLTGVWSHKHNVWDNDIAAPNYSYPSIFSILKTSNPKATTGIFSTWTDNRTKLVGEGLAQTGGFKMDQVFDGLELDTARFPSSDPLRISKIDDLVATAAAKAIEEKGPDLSWVYLEFTDDMGHRYGDSPQFYDAVRKADEQVGRIWKRVKEREKNFHEEWMVVVTTDHGRTAADGKGHGGQSDRERTTWIFTNAKKLNRRFREDQLEAVDIAPSLARFLELNVPESIAQEWDGVPFIGPLSITNLNARLLGDKIELTWQGSSNDPVMIQLSTTNHFREGKPDTFEPAGTTVASAGSYTIDSPPPSSFYKVVVKGKHNAVNAWVIKKD